MKIAFIGQKGIPATTGGVERHVEELSSELAAMGHDVTVFVRKTYTDQGTGAYRGVRTVELPTVGTKHLDAIVHSVLCTIYCLGRGYDVVHYHAVGPALVSPVSKLRKGVTVATVHAQDWRQAKWNKLARAALKCGELAALKVPDETIVVSKVLQRTYESSGYDVNYIPNGVRRVGTRDESVLRDLGLEPGTYGLFVGRLIPDKGVHELADAWRRAGLSSPLVIVGDSSFTDTYACRLRADYGDVCVFAGGVFGPQLASLFEKCRLFVLPSHVEGMPLVLLEAQAYGARVLASDIPENLELLRERDSVFRVGDVDHLVSQLHALWGAAASAPGSAVRSEFEWNSVADQTVALYRSALQVKRGGGAHDQF